MPPKRRTEDATISIEEVNYRELLTGLALLLLSALSSTISLLSLPPVYGSAPSSIFHGTGVSIAAASGWFFRDRVEELFGHATALLLPVLASWIPTIQYILFQKSASLGNPLGPIVTESLTYLLLILLSVACAGKLIESGLSIKGNGGFATRHVPLLGSYVVFCMGLNLAKAFISECMGYTFLVTRSGLQFTLAMLYAVLTPSKWLLFAIPSVFFSFTGNVHLPLAPMTGVLNSTLQQNGWALLARQDSSTGYISVLENMDEGFRVMRCDHSLLGGQWTKMPMAYKPLVEDPIYAVFTMLEAVRLVVTEEKPRFDHRNRALVIGLGVGSAPAAMVKHGVETTIVEIDPVVHRFATDFFHLPKNHIAAIEDATSFVKRTQGTAEYDYIIHDVFTGGAEPVELFTVEFLRGLRSLLRSDGVIAINYAGDISIYPARLIVRTIQSVFPNCRMFRELQPTDDGSNFTNMVIFCKTSTATPLRFREAVPEDYLRSKTREMYLVPKHEVEAVVFKTVEDDDQAILRANETGLLRRFQDQSAIAHWRIMRQVLPAKVWENW